MLFLPKIRTTLLSSLYALITIFQTFVVVVSEPPRIPACYSVNVLTELCLDGLYQRCGNNLCCSLGHDCCKFDGYDACCPRNYLEGKEIAVLSVGAIMFFVIGVLLSVCIGRYWKRRLKGLDE